MRRGQCYRLPYAVVASENVTRLVPLGGRGSESRLWGIPMAEEPLLSQTDGSERGLKDTGKSWKIAEGKAGPWAGCGGGCGRKTVRTR